MQGWYEKQMQQHTFSLSKLACGGAVVVVQCQEIAEA
jgi:hypothetical protein